MALTVPSTSKSIIVFDRLRARPPCQMCVLMIRLGGAKRLVLVGLHLEVSSPCALGHCLSVGSHVASSGRPTAVKCCKPKKNDVSTSDRGENIRPTVDGIPHDTWNGFQGLGSMLPYLPLLYIYCEDKAFTTAIIESLQLLLYAHPCALRQTETD